jgi:hypothetical protein
MPQLMAMAVVKAVQLLCLVVASDFGAEFHLISSYPLVN